MRPDDGPSLGDIEGDTTLPRYVSLFRGIERGEPMTSLRDDLIASGRTDMDGLLRSVEDRYKRMLGALSQFGSLASDPKAWFATASVEDALRLREHRRAFLRWFIAQVQPAIEAGRPDHARRLYLRRLELQERPRFTAKEAAEAAERGREAVGDHAEVVQLYLLAAYATFYFPTSAPDATAAIAVTATARSVALASGDAPLARAAERTELMFRVHLGQARDAVTRGRRSDADVDFGWEPFRFAQKRARPDLFAHFFECSSLEEARDRLARAMIPLSSDEDLAIYAGAVLHFEGGERTDTVEAFDALVEAVLAGQDDWKGLEVVRRIGHLPLPAARIRKTTDWFERYADELQPPPPFAKPKTPKKAPPEPPPPPARSHVVDLLLARDLEAFSSMLTSIVTRQGAARHIDAMLVSSPDPAMWTARIGDAFDYASYDLVRSSSELRRRVKELRDALLAGFEERGGDVAEVRARDAVRAREHALAAGGSTPEEDQRVRRRFLDELTAELRSATATAPDQEGERALEVARLADWANDAEALLHYATLAATKLAERRDDRAALAMRYRAGALLELRRWEEAFAILDAILGAPVPPATRAWSMKGGFAFYPSEQPDRAIVEAREVALWASARTTAWVRALGALADVFRDDDDAAPLLAVRFARALGEAEDGHEVMEQLLQRQHVWAAARVEAWLDRPGP